MAKARVAQGPLQKPLLEVLAKRPRTVVHTSEPPLTTSCLKLAVPVFREMMEPGDAGTAAVDAVAAAIAESHCSVALDSGSAEKMTPRMRCALAYAAGAGAAALRLRACEGFIDGQLGSGYWGSAWFPVDLQCGVFKTFLLGMADILDVVGGLLRGNQVPTTEAIHRVLSPFGSSAQHALGLNFQRHAVSHFFGKGGQLEYVLLAVVEDAAVFYDSQEDSSRLDDGESLANRTYHNLPLKMLDGDFDFVRCALGAIHI